MQFSPIKHYDSTFECVLPTGIRIADLLISRPNVTVIDLLSPPMAIWSLFRQLPQRDKLGIAVALTDRTLDIFSGDEGEAPDSRIETWSYNLVYQKSLAAIERRLRDLGRTADLNYV